MLSVVLVVVQVGRRRIERDEQRFMQAPRIGSRVGTELLGEQIEIVVRRLESDHGTKHQLAV